MKRCIPFVVATAVWVFLLAQLPVSGQSTSSSEKSKESSSESKETKSTPTPPPYASILKEASPKSGLWTVYQRGQNLYWEIASSDYSSE